MTTSADEPTRPTVPNRSDAPTLTPGELSQRSDATRATAPAATPSRPGMSDTQATVPAMVSGTAPTQVISPSGMSATAATVKSGEDLMTRPPPSSPSGAYDGQTWGDFKLGKMLGRGGMGAVYAGKQMSLDRPVAIKVLIGHLADNEDFRKRFLLEARAAARINSPHVVQVYYAGTHGDLDFFAMEYVEGTDISRRLKDGWLPSPAECLELIVQATRSLVALGDHKIVHRDIKPANYMLTTAGVVKLMDFGLVKFASEAHGLTQTGTIMGTVNYFSPEQGRGDVCDQRTDIYALGVMFYEMLTGKLPFTGGDATSVIYQHIHAEPKPPKIHNPSVTEPYQSVVLKCLEKDPKNRYQTAKELLDDLERITRGEMPLAGKAGKSGGAMGGQSSARKLILAAAVIIAAVILGLAIMLRPTTTAVAVAGATTTSATVNDPTVSAISPPTTSLTPPSTPPPTIPNNTPVVIAPSVVTAVTPTPAPVVNLPPAKPAEATVTPPPVAPLTPVVATLPPAKPPVAEAPPAKPVEPPVVVAVAPAKPVPPPVLVEAPAKPIPPPPPELLVEKPIAPPVVAVAPSKPVPPPAKLTTPAPLSAPVQSTLRIAIPAGDALLTSSTWLWWLEGPNGRSGRLSARSTRVPEISWTAPALPADVTLHVAAVGSERRLKIPLTAVAATSASTATLTPFLRANFAEERHVQRLRRDLDGSWWLVDVDGATISRNVDGWLSGGRFQPTPPAPRPVAVATSTTHVAVLDSNQPSLLIYGRDASAARVVTGFQRPTDVVALSDGTWAVADIRSGGVLVFDQQGVRVRTHVRSGNGGWDLLTRLATDGRLLYALDSGSPAIAVFAGEPLPLTVWSLDRSDKPLAIAAAAGRVYVLGTSGAIRLLDPKGQVVQTLPSAVSALPDESLGVPGDLSVDATGELYVTYPDREMIARHSADGKQLGIRHARMWTWKAYAADGANRLYAIDAEHRRVVVLDADGWRLATFGKAVRQGGTLDSPLALAVHPDGAALAVLDEETLQITRFDTAAGTNLVFGSPGKGDGQFDSPISVAMDEVGRTYVLDQGLRRVSVFDAQGRFIRHFGRYERGDAPDMLRSPLLVTVSNDGGTVFVYDEATSLIKSFAFDHATNQVRHSGNFGGRGDGPGQFTRIMGMGCDRRGRIYCLDYKRGDLQVFDTTGQAPMLLTTLRGEQAGIRKMLNLAVHPDGIPYIIGGDQFTGLRWQLP